MKKSNYIVSFLMLSVFTSCLSFGETLSSSRTMNNLYNQRYCEIIAMKSTDQLSELFKLNIVVYNTLGLNDCPTAQWKNLKANEVEKQLSAKKVVLNGPRYWLMDTIQISGVRNKEEVVIGGIGMQKVVQLHPYLWQGIVGSQVYKINVVHQKANTTFIFNSGTEVYELVDSSGNIYVMQSYSQLVDHNLKIPDLKTLGTRLKLPDGWKYKVVTLNQPLLLEINNGTAYVVSDEFRNAYRRLAHKQS